MTKPKNRRLRSFSRPERRKLQKLLEEGGGELFEEKFYQELTDEFNHAEATNDRVKIEVEQVRRWFCSRKGDHVGKPVSAPIDSMELASLSDSTSGSKEMVSSPNSLPGSSKELIVAPDPKVSNNAPESTADMAKGKKVEKEEWEFEARSSREGAWYDVADFLAYRNNGAGLHEAHVRFQDFGAEEDEWVDLLKAVRVRSIPLESSDCPRVAVGDLVLCFRESKDRAAYYDAHIMEIERRQHDIRGCRCRFSMKFDLNEVEVRDLDIPVKIIDCEITRDFDGIALSSRNVRLSPEEREKALSISKSLARAKLDAENGNKNCKELKDLAYQTISEAGGRIEYVEIVEQESLQTLEEINCPVMMCVAAWFGNCRLIDNVEINLSS